MKVALPDSMNCSIKNERAIMVCYALRQQNRTRYFELAHPKMSCEFLLVDKSLVGSTLHDGSGLRNCLSLGSTVGDLEVGLDEGFRIR